VFCHWWWTTGFTAHNRFWQDMQLRNCLFQATLHTTHYTLIKLKARLQFTFSLCNLTSSSKNIWRKHTQPAHKPFWRQRVPRYRQGSVHCLAQYVSWTLCVLCLLVNHTCQLRHMCQPSYLTGTGLRWPDTSNIMHIQCHTQQYATYRLNCKKNPQMSSYQNITN